MQFIKDRNNVVFASAKGDVGLEEGWSLFNTENPKEADFIIANLGNVKEVDGKITIIDESKLRKPSVMVEDKNELRRQLGL